MKLFAVLRVPLLLLGAFAAVACDRCSHRPPVASPPTPTETVLPRASTSLIPDVLDGVTPAVVSIYSLRAGARKTASSFAPFGPGEEGGLHSEQNLGSGVIVRSDGIIVTNQHVVDAAEEVKVVLWDRREFRATVVGQDLHTDIALLRVNAGTLPAVPLADSGHVRIGETVLAIGNALGLGQTVSCGIIGARGRTNIGIVDDEDFLQTDASMNPGSSGGPLVNLKGEIIGINTAIATRTGGFQGIGFVIPSRLVKEVLDLLLRDGRINRGDLGITMQEVTPGLAAAFDLDRPRGVVVTEVVAQSGSDKAGLRRGDVLLAMDGKPVTTRADLEHRVAMRGARTKITLDVWREGRSIALTVQLGALEEAPVPPRETAAEEDPGGRPSGLTGVTVRPVTQAMLREVGIHDEEGGLIVTGVQSSGIFAGIRRGDLIVEVNRRPVHEVEEVMNAISLKGQAVLVRVRRSEGSVYIMVPN
jgi:serine protease Do